MITKSSQLTALGNVVKTPKETTPYRERRTTRIARGIGHALRTTVFNTMTPRSERDAISSAAEQATSSVHDTRTIEQRIDAYLEAPMTPSGEHPDPTAPEYNLFGE